MMNGMIEMPVLSVDNLVIDQMVSTLIFLFDNILNLTELHTGAEALSHAYFGQGRGRINLDDVNCDSTEMTLLECDTLFIHNCHHQEDASVRCTRLKNINASVIDISCMFTTVSISWELQNNTVDEPNLFEVECSSERHSIMILESSHTFTTELGGLLSSIFYDCCVSAVYSSYPTKKLCIPIEIPNLSTTDLVHVTVDAAVTNTTVIVANTTMHVPELAPRTSNSASVIGGVLGSIIVALLILLALLVIALVYPILGPRLNKNKTLSR